MTEQEYYYEMREIRKVFEVVKGEATEIPTPINNIDAMKQLKGLYGAEVYIMYKFEFYNNLGYSNKEAIKKAIKEKIEDLDNFITTAENKRITDKSNVKKRQEDLNEYDYFLRLKYDYYVDKDFHYNDVGSDKPLAKVYGTYTLFYNYLKEKLKELEQNEPDKKEVQVSSIPTEIQSANNNINIDGLKILDGNWKGANRIMKKEEYSRVIEYFEYMMYNQKLPEQKDIIKVKTTLATSDFIRYTFYRFWHNRKHISRDLFVDFLHSVFEQFSGTTKTTIKKKFSTPYTGYDDLIKDLTKNHKTP